MSDNNPFGDPDDEEQKQQLSTVDFVDDYDPSLDPFANENDDQNDDQDHHHHLNQIGSSIDGSSSGIDIGIGSGKYDCSTPIVMNNNKNKSLSRLSITSSTTSSLSNQSFNENQTLIKQYQLGDGNLEKEGLLCPDCLKQYKTITELMKHFDDEHQSSSSSSVSNNSKLFQTSISSLINPTQQMTGQIKGFLNKFLLNTSSSLSLNKSNQSLISTTTSLLLNQSNNNNNNKDFNNDFNKQNLQELEQQQQQQQKFLLNPILQWKNSMLQGPRRSHFEQFKKLRENHIERYIFETNKLLIILDKLLKDYPPINDLQARKKHEQSIVEWLDESIVNLCPSCAIKFSLINRKHHCRLCGAIMCNKCCYFISIEFALKLINPIIIGDGDGSNLDNQSITSFSIGKSLLLLNKTNEIESSFDTTTTSSSTTNTSAVVSPFKSMVKKFNTNMNQLILSGVSVATSTLDHQQQQENLDKLRCCLNCKTLLLIRNEKIDVQHFKSPLVKLYEQLRQLIEKIDKLIPIYYRMAHSISIGENTYQLEDGHQLKLKLTKLGEEIDLLSRRIESNGLDLLQQQQQQQSNPDDSSTTTTTTTNTPNTSSNIIPPSPKQLSIQTAIRRSTIQYLQKQLLGLPELPTEKQFELLKIKHQEFIQKRIEMEKQLALLEQEKFRKISNKNQQQQQQSSSIEKIIIGNSEDAFCATIKTNELDPSTNTTSNTTALWSNMTDIERKEILQQTDPILQQILIIKSYIKQAELDNRYEELSMLKLNLKQLNIEYYFAQQQKQEQEEQEQDSKDSEQDSMTKQSSINTNPFEEEEEEKKKKKDFIAEDNKNNPFDN